MRWSINNPDAGKIIATYVHYGQPIPKGLEPPALHDVEQYYWSAFWDLSGDRQAGGAIPWSALRQYFQVDGFGKFRDFHKIIKLMDNFYSEATKPKVGK